jgi:hypothetical protein
MLDKVFFFKVGFVYIRLGKFNVTPFYPTVSPKACINAAFDKSYEKNEGYNAADEVTVVSEKI